MEYIAMSLHLQLIYNYISNTIMVSWFRYFNIINNTELNRSLVTLILRNLWKYIIMMPCDQHFWNYVSRFNLNFAMMATYYHIITGFCQSHFHMVTRYGNRIIYSLSNIHMTYSSFKIWMKRNKINFES